MEIIKENGKGNFSFSESTLKKDKKFVDWIGKSSKNAKVIQIQGANELEQILYQMSLLNNKVEKLECEIMTQSSEFKYMKKQLEGLTKTCEVQKISEKSEILL